MPDREAGDASGSFPPLAASAPIAAAAASVAASGSSQAAGGNSRQESGQEAASVTAQIDRPIWQASTKDVTDLAE